MNRPDNELRLSGPEAQLCETLRVLDRRRLLKLIGGAGALALLPHSSFACTLIPPEMVGPYPADGTNGPNMLTESGIVRTDIRPSFGSYGTDVAPGTPLEFTLQFVSTIHGCGPVEGLAVHVWHCDAGGLYSLYSQGATNQNYLRGVQVTDASGRATFTTIFPGCYLGRWPHIHFEVFASIEEATHGNNAGRISQLALPEDACRSVYAQGTLYPNGLSHLNGVTLESDGIFGDDGGVHQLATTTGDNAQGYVSTLEVGLAVDATTGDLIFADGFEQA